VTTNDILIDAFGRIKHVVHDVVKDMGEEKLSERPGEDANSIAWLVWHLARVQDDHIAELKGSEQIWTSGGWYDTFSLPFPDTSTGYGHSSADVGMVRASADILTGYYDAVHDETIAYIKSLKPDDYERIVDEHYNPPVSLAVRLFSVIDDDLQHAGQAAYVKGLIR
jgi:uncharacterized damage-inducible protein DinB